MNLTILLIKTHRSAQLNCDMSLGLLIYEHPRTPGLLKNMTEKDVPSKSISALPKD